jgi:hypothetical protein
MHHPIISWGNCSKRRQACAGNVKFFYLSAYEPLKVNIPASCVTYLNNIAKVTDDIAEKVSTAKNATDGDFELQQEIILSKLL